MVLFIILVLMLLLLALTLVLAISAVGAGAILLFGDVIVCVVFIVLICKAILKKKRRK